MKKTNKVIAAVAAMAITMTIPAMAGNNPSNKNWHENNKKVVTVDKNKKVVYTDKNTKYVNHKPAYRPDVKTYTFKVNTHGKNTKNVVAKAERVNGVLDAKYNHRTHEMTVRYDAKRTSPRNIKRALA